MKSSADRNDMKDETENRVEENPDILKSLPDEDVRRLVNAGADQAEVRMLEDEIARVRAEMEGYRRRNAELLIAVRKFEAERDDARARERAAKEEAEEKEQGRLESLRALAGGVSHDLNNLLVIINVNAELALEKATDPALRELIEGIDHAARRIGTIAKQMLTYSGGIELTKEPLDLSKSVHETGHLLSVTLSRKGSLKFNLAEGLPPIEADRSAVQQIVVNLLLNAADAVEGYRGTIVISTGSVYADRQYLDRTHLGKDLPQGRYEYLEVLDDGIGMSKNTLDKLFEPFYTTKFTGRGMGLASVFGIVREHGGAIEVESAPRKGTRIRVLMPQSDKPYLPAEDDKKRNAHRGSGTILLVDDEEDVLNMTEKVLQLNGYDVITADDGPVAIETFKSRNGEVSAVVIDLIMPDMPGDETSREIRKMSPEVPIILLSGYHEIDTAVMKEEFGITAVIRKPYRIDAFLKTLQGIMERSE